MRRIKYYANYGHAGTDVEDILEYPDGTPDKEIEEDVNDLVMQRVDWGWTDVTKCLEGRNNG